MQDREPDLVGLLCHLKFKYHVKKYAAIQNLEIYNFDKMWIKWATIFE
jgi:hypothetical protein